MERCPCCNARLGGLLSCPRCQTDLSAVTASIQSAQVWLQQAIQQWAKNDVEQSVKALVFSLHLKQSQLGLVFCDFIIDQQSKKISALLAQKQVMAAKRQLYKLRLLIPHSLLLLQMRSYIDYLLVNTQDSATPNSNIKNQKCSS